MRKYWFLICALPISKTAATKRNWWGRRTQTIEDTSSSSRASTTKQTFSQTPEDGGERDGHVGSGFHFPESELSAAEVIARQLYVLRNVLWRSSWIDVDWMAKSKYADREVLTARLEEIKEAMASESEQVEEVLPGAGELSNAIRSANMAQLWQFYSAARRLIDIFKAQWRIFRDGDKVLHDRFELRKQLIWLETYLSEPEPSYNLKIIEHSLIFAYFIDIPLKNISAVVDLYRDVPQLHEETDESNPQTASRRFGHRHTSNKRKVRAAAAGQKHRGGRLRRQHMKRLGRGRNSKQAKKYAASSS